MLGEKCKRERTVENAGELVFTIRRNQRWREPKFSPRMWLVYERVVNDEPRTTNMLEEGSIHLWPKVIQIFMISLVAFEKNRPEQTHRSVNYLWEKFLNLLVEFRSQRTRESKILFNSLKGECSILILYHNVHKIPCIYTYTMVHT